MIDVGVDASAFLAFEGEIVKGCFEIFDPFSRSGGVFWFHSSNVSHGTDKNENGGESAGLHGPIATLWRRAHHSGTMPLW
jgi:hypothetical protein